MSSLQHESPTLPRDWYSEGELAEMTGYRQHKRQAGWLAEKCIAFRPRRDGSLLVFRSPEVQTAAAARPKTQPNFSAIRKSK